MEIQALKYGARAPEDASIWPLRDSDNDKKGGANKYTLLVLMEKG
jgi:hypothetical protein